MIVYCDSCGAQNFIGEERREIADLSPPACWVCFSPLPLSEESSGEKGESNNVTIER